MGELDNKQVNDNQLGLMTKIFFSLYLVLPEYLGVEISGSLPLITGSRMILILFFFTVLFHDYFQLRISLKLETTFSRRLVIYFSTIIIANLYYITSTSTAINSLFTLIIEELLIVYLICRVINSKEKVISALSIIMKASGAVALISIISTFTGTNLFYYLKTVNREMLMASYSRLGLVRAEAGFGHAVYYGVYCALMIPICLFFIERNKGTKNFIPTLCLFLNIIGLILANSRGSLVTVLIILGIMFIKEGGLNFINKYRFQICIGIVSVVALCVFSTSALDFLGQIFSSIKAIIFPESVTLSSTYGTNADGLSSRLSQISMAWWTLQSNPIFGLGAESQTRGVVKALTTSGKWGITNTFDVGYVAIICDYGLLGIVGFVALFSIIPHYLSRRYSAYHSDQGIAKLFKYLFLTYFVALLSVSELHDTFWVLFGLYLAYVSCEFYDIPINSEE